MASAVPPPGTLTLGNGPPDYEGRMAFDLIPKIVERGPALGSAYRAWWSLGYTIFNEEEGSWLSWKYRIGNNPPVFKPPQAMFERQVSAMWTFLAESDEGQTLEGRKALGLILESLRALRYRHRGWGLDSALSFSTSGVPGQEHPARPWFDEGVAWEDLPSPIRHPLKVPSVYDAALEELARSPEDSLLSAQRLHEGVSEERMLWTKYYAYQGFVVENADNEGRHFTAVPVPEENSLWHSLSYHLAPRTNSGFPNMMRHYEIKACIWAYFTQVLEHPEHIRWREYIYLNYYSASDDDLRDNVYGSSTISRHLHCNEPIHHALTPTLWTSPVFRPPTDILHVIADYYAVQIILFTHPTATAGYVAPDQEQTAFCHTAQIFGSLHNPEGHKPIFLFTTDLTRGIFSPAIPGEDKPFTPHAHITSYPSMAPWWQPGAGPDPLQIPPYTIPHFAIPGSPEINPNANLWAPNPGTELTTHMVELFRHGRDIPGRSMDGVPSRETVEGWTHAVEPLKYNITRRARKQIRYGGLTGAAGWRPGDEDSYKWTLFMYWALQARTQGALEYSRR
ncbi:hypothetical protein QBC39DRAFT_331975 [Podospora conica]|nr:hypothetical protein QBC39DRAFT_331975 [Schizothecium conicum]